MSVWEILKDLEQGRDIFNIKVSKYDSEGRNGFYRHEKNERVSNMSRNLMTRTSRLPFTSFDTLP